MSSLANDALTYLHNELLDLLPDGSGAAVELLPTVLRPHGLGGYVGHQADPAGDLEARWFEGQVDVAIEAGDEAALAILRRDTVTALVAAERSELRRRGIYRLQLDAQSDPVEQGNGNNATVSQHLRFALQAEYVHHPETAGGLIERLIHDWYVPGGGQLHRRYQREFRQDPLADFDVVDDPAATTQAPSDWSHDAAAGGLVQGRSIRGGQNVFSARKPGTMLLLRNHRVADGLLRVGLQSDSGGGIGVVFRYQGPDDYCFFLMDATVGYRLLAQKRAGNFSLLQDGGRDQAASYEVGTLHDLRVAFEGEQVAVALDGAVVLDGRDDRNLASGRVGLLVRGDDEAFFNRLSLTGIGP